MIISNNRYSKNNNYPTNQHIPITYRDNNKTLYSRYDSQGSNLKQRVIGKVVRHGSCGNKWKGRVTQQNATYG